MLERYSSFISIAVTIPAIKQGREGLFGLQFQAAVHHGEEARVGTQSSIVRDRSHVPCLFSYY